MIAFQEIKNNLHRTVDMKSLKLANDYYEATVFYYGDYKQDKQNNSICVDNITVRCKPKADNLPILYLNGELFIEMTDISVLAIEQAKAMRKKLEIAEQSANELRNILKYYF